MNTQFQCDVCRNWISSPKEGTLQWVTYSDSKSGRQKIRDLRIVHNWAANKNDHCLFNETHEHSKDGGIVGDMPLDHYSSMPDGLTYLLQMIAEGEAEKMEVIRIIQRIFTDGYEEARDFITLAISQGLVDDNLAPGFYHESTL